MCNCRSHSSAYGYCSHTYEMGYRDGLLQGQREYDALNGPDRTMYQFIGGPKHGERVETGGQQVVVVPLPMPMSAATYCGHIWNCGPISCGHPCCGVRDWPIKTGTYEKTRTTHGVTVYRWKP